MSPRRGRQRGALTTAGLWRRLPAVVLDAAPAAALVAMGFALGVFDARIFAPPHGWFWTEWLFKFWLDERLALLAPLLSFVGLAVAWTALWEATRGRTPAGQLLGLLVVDRHAHKIGPSRAVLRAVGSLLNVATLGLGYLWVVVSTYRRGWHDLLAGTVVVVEASATKSPAGPETVGESPADTL